MKKLLSFLLTFTLFLVNAMSSKDSIQYKIAVENIYKNPDYSIDIIKQLLNNNPKIEDKAKLYWQISTAYNAKREYDMSLKYVSKAQDLLDEINSPKDKMRILLTIAVLYQQMDLYTKCFDVLNEAEIISTTIPDNDETKIHLLGNVNAIKGMIYKNQSSPEMALEKFNQAKINYQKILHRKSSKANLSVILYNIGYTYLIKDDLLEAEKSFNQSIHYAKSSNANSLEAFALKGLSEIYFSKGNYKETLTLLNKAEILAEPIGDLVLNQGIFKGKADAYLAMNQIEKYQVYNKKYLQNNFERQQNELLSINVEIDNQIENIQDKINGIKDNTIHFILIISSIGSIFSGILIFMIIKFRKENNKLKIKINELIQSS